MGGMVVVGLSRSMWGLMHARERVVEAENRVRDLEQENRELAEEYLYQTSEEYLEMQVRDKLNMAKPGEVVVVMPEMEEDASNQKPVTREDGNSDEEKVNWERWMAIFL